MRLSSTSFVLCLPLSVAVLASSALACNGNKGGGFGGGFGGGGIGVGYSRGGFSVGVGTGGPYGGNYGGVTSKNYDRHCDTYGGGYNSGPYGQGGPVYGQALEPFHSYYFVQPGDTFYEVSLKEYGTSAAARHIARFNRLASNAALTPGQRLMLPAVSANGRLTQSRSPAPTEGTVSQGPGNTPSPKVAPVQTTTAARTTTPAPSTEPLPKLTTGAVISLDGQNLGMEQGLVRLKVSGLAMPVEVLEWNESSTKVRLPQLDLASATQVELEVLRADGSVASSNTVELTTANSKLASKN